MGRSNLKYHYQRFQTSTCSSNKNSDTNEVKRNKKSMKKQQQKKRANKQIMSNYHLFASFLVVKFPKVNATRDKSDHVVQVGQTTVVS